MLFVVTMRQDPLFIWEIAARTVLFGIENVGGFG